MALYHEAPFTLQAETVIPDDALPAVGVDEYGNREAVAAASEEWAPDSKIDYAIEQTGMDVTITLTPASELEEGYSIDWDFGNGRREHAPDLRQTVTYQSPGTYLVSATINQPTQPTLQFSGEVAVESPPES